MMLVLGGLRVDVPDGFHARLVGITAPAKAPLQLGGRAMLKTQATFQRTVVITAESLPQGTTNEAYAQAQYDQTMKQLRDFSLIEKRELPLKNGKASFYESHAAGPTGAKIGSVTATAVVGKTGYTVSASALVGPDYAAGKKEYVAVIESLR